MRDYVEPGQGRHRIKRVDGIEEIRIPVRRQWFVIFFLPFWLAMWTVGGIGAMTAVAGRFDWFLIFWLGGWAVGWVFAAVTLLTQFTGGETLRVVHGDLEVIHRIGPFRRTWRYRGSTIRNLSRYDPERPRFGRGMDVPLGIRTRSGAVRFDYGSDTLYVAGGVDGPEGGEIADWLGARLPHSAISS